MSVTEFKCGFSDEPIDGSPSAPDELERSRFAQVLAGAIQEVATERASTVIGLVGAWGSGKSSLIKLVSSQLEGADLDGITEARWNVIEFNPWFYQDLPSLQWGFLGSLYDAVATEAGKRAKKVRSTIQTFGRAIAPAGVAGNLVGLDLSGVVREAADLVGPDRSVARQQATLDKLLKKRSAPVLIVLDDLDRLAPDELLLVFKLIRLVGRLPYVHYLIAYDEETLLDVLTRTGLVGLDRPHRAGAYLEKMIQLRFDVPPLRASQIDGLIDRAIDRMTSSVGLEMDQRQIDDFAATWQMYIQREMRTPRMVKRYAAQVEALYGAISTEVDPTDFLLLTWLKVMAPQLYASLPAEKALLTGFAASVFSAIGDRDQKPLDFTDRWQSMIKASVVVSGSEESVAGVLAKLFPRYKAIQSEANGFSGDVRDARKVANPDYFDRYFALEVPSDDIPDTVMDVAYRAIVAGEDNVETRRMSEALISNTSLAVRKLEARFEEARNSDDASALLWWVAQRVDQVPEGGDLFGPRRTAQGLCVRLYLQLPPRAAALVAVIDRTATLPSGLRLIALMTGQARTHTFFGHDADVKARQEAFPAGLERYGKLIAEEFDRNRDTPPLSLDDDTRSMLWDWRIIDLEQERSWLETQFDSKRWTRLDVAACLVTSTAPIGTGQWTISDLDLSAVEDLVGIDQLFLECTDLPPLALGERISPGTQTTVDSRRNCVRTVMADIEAGRRTRP